MTFCHGLQIVLLYIAIVFLGCIWTVGCFVVIMTSVCLKRWGENCLANRTGGCHDLPFICAGVDEAVEWSVWGWRSLWMCVEPPDPPDDEEQQRQEAEEPEIRRPPRAAQRR